MGEPPHLPAIIWDFDGTILPFDSEQALLRSLLREPRRKVGIAKAVLARGLAWADQHGYLERSFKRLYARCLRGLRQEELDILSEELARRIPAEDRQVIHAIHELGREMHIISCGTGDLSTRILQAAGLGDCFASIEANWFIFRDNRIERMNISIHMAEDKLEAAARLGIPLPQAIAIGDGITDVPLLDRAAVAILVSRTGRKAEWAKGKGYHAARSLSEIVPLLGSARHRTC